MKKIDLTGRLFGQLTVIEFVRSANYASYYLCQCNCGNTKVVDGNNLRRGHVKSCGCRRITENKSGATHGMTKTKIYGIWVNMWRRCTEKANASYQYYGARGIKVCKRWKSFENFYADMGDCKEGFTIERINVNGDYEPSNCKWIRAGDQALNRRSNRELEYGGEVLCVTQWSRKLNIKKSTLLERLRRGWSVEKALSTPSLKGVTP